MAENDLAIKGTEQVSHAQLVAREFAQRLKYMLVNGQKLADHDVFALAQYASATGLDPFAGECWIIPGKGVCPGIAGWRKKAQEQLEYEAKDAKEDGAHYWSEFVESNPGDCIFDSSKGDIAYTVVLRDSISQHRWRLSVIETSNEFMKMGAKFDEALKQAKELVGKEPLWIGHGVVFAGESFGGNEKFDRIERAQKRAEKLAIKKRFPRIHLPEPEGVNDVVDAGDFSVAVDEIKPHTVEENMKVLGFGDDEQREPAKEKLQPTAERPYSPEALKDRLQVLADSFAGKTCTEGDRTSVRLNLKAMAGGEDEYHLLLHWLTGASHIADVQPNEILAIKKWIGVKKQEDDSWVADAMSIKEAKTAFTEALKDAGQLSMDLPADNGG